MKYTTPYIPPTLVVDIVLFQIINDELNVLLLKRPSDPFKNQWALPGGYNPKGETTKQALKRIIDYKVHVDINKLDYLEQLHAFDTVARDPRGHAVSITYLGAGYDIKPNCTADTATFFPVSSLPKVAYDHAEIIDFAHKKMISEITHTTTIKVLLSPLFRLAELQSAYETILGKSLDKRNFQKKIFKLDIIEKTDKFFHHPTARPASLYKFKSKNIDTLSTSLD
jgi:ADP-ribose pyrophosphatase